MEEIETPLSIIIIPAYNPPPEALLKLVHDLIHLNVEKIIIVNDGSDADKISIFNNLKNYKECCVLSHAVNLGKGRALKTAFNYVLNEYPKTSYVITVDADGQHNPLDVKEIVAASLKDKNRFFIGTRSFDDKVPFRSKLGNIVTRYIFRFLIGMKISDTQSGLRGIPTSLLPRLLKISGEGYEYELAMLIAVKEFGLVIREIPIGTIYIKNNESSKFNPFVDSMKIYFVFFRFAFSSLFAAFLDFIIFIIAFFFTENVFISLVASRVLVSIINFSINRNFVFRGQQNNFLSLVKYYLLVCFIMILTYLLISLFNSKGVPIYLAKIVAETILFVISFTLQRDYVFSGIKSKIASDEDE